MSNQRYTPEFKDEAARQIVDRGLLPFLPRKITGLTISVSQGAPIESL